MLMHCDFDYVLVDQVEEKLIGRWFDGENEFLDNVVAIDVFDECYDIWEEYLYIQIQQMLCV